MKKFSYPQLLMFSALISLLLSFFALHTREPLNPDSILYIKTAQAYLHQGFAAASAVYNWPFFSIVGACFSKITGLSLFHAFHALNILCQLFIVLGFIQLIKNLNASKTVLAWAALVILIYPTLNIIRDYITRDFAYCAFALYAVLFLLKYLKFAQWKDGILWGFLMILAGCFRIEGFVFLVALPLVCLWRKNISWQIRIKDFFITNIVLIIAGVVGALFFLLHHHSAAILPKQTYWQQFVQSVLIVPHKLQADTILLRKAILDGLSKSSASTILLGGLVTIVIVGILTALKPLYLLLACFGQQQKLITNERGEVSLLVWVIIVNVIVFSSFVLKYYFFEPRYSMFMALIWMSWVPFALEKISQAWKINQQRFRWIWPLILVWLLEMAISGVGHFGPSKAYIPASGRWLAQHMQPKQSLFSNSAQISFYASEDYTNQDRLQHLTEGALDDLLAKTNQYDWIAIRINADDNLTPAAQKFLSMQHSVAVFENKRHDRVWIYSGLKTG